MLLELQYACNGTNNWFSGGYRYCGRRAASADWWTQQPPTENNNGWDCIVRLWFKWSHIIISPVTLTPAAADKAERLVVSKTKCQDYINVYVEDASDWKGNMELRGRLYRKQILTFRACQIQSLVANYVSIEISQWCDGFHWGKRITDQLSPHKLGGPFYTSSLWDDNMNDDDWRDDNRFEDDERFVAASGAKREDSDRVQPWKRMKHVQNAKALLTKTGISPSSVLY